jgi:PKD repeat protein
LLFTQLTPIDFGFPFLAIANEKVYFSDDGGSTWTNISGTLPNIPANCIIINELDSLETIYLGTDLGVFTKDSTSLNWNNLNSGTLPNVIVSELEIQYSSNKLFAATFGRGLWSFDLQITTPPIANFSVDDSVFCSVPATVNFTNNSFYSILIFGILAMETQVHLLNPSHTYLNYGNYSVSLIATGPLGVDTIVYPSLININHFKFLYCYSSK